MWLALFIGDCVTKSVNEILDEIIEKTGKFDEALDKIYIAIVELGRGPPRIRNLVRELREAMEK